MITKEGYLELPSTPFFIAGDGVMRYEDSDLRARIKSAAAEADPNPSDSQKEYGNYRKGHVTIQGLPITIENAKGSMRSGKGKDGKAWSIEMKSHYGYIKRTESEADGDHIDVFIGPHPESEIVFVIDQHKQSGRFDEHKCMIGWTCEHEARQGYLENYSPGWNGLGGIKALRMDEFKDWIRNGETGNRIEDQRFMYEFVSRDGRLNDLSDWIIQRETQAFAKAQENLNPKEQAKHSKRLADELKRRLALKHMMIDYDYMYEDISAVFGEEIYGDIDDYIEFAKGDSLYSSAWFDALPEKAQKAAFAHMDAGKGGGGRSKSMVSPDGKLTREVKPAVTNEGKLSPAAPAEAPAPLTPAPAAPAAESKAPSLLDKMRAKQPASKVAPTAAAPPPLVDETGKMPAPTPAGETSPEVAAPSPPMYKGKVPSFTDDPAKEAALEKSAPKEMQAWREAVVTRKEGVKSGKMTMDQSMKFRKNTLEPAYNALKSKANQIKSQPAAPAAAPAAATAAPATSTAPTAAPESKMTPEAAPPAAAAPAALPTEAKANPESPQKKQFGKPAPKPIKSHEQKRLKLNYDAKKDRTGDTLYKMVSRMGGISRESVRALGLDLNAYMESHLSGLFPREGGMSLEDIASDLQSEGHVDVPGTEYKGPGESSAGGMQLPTNAGEHVMNLLLDKAKSLQANRDEEYRKEYDRYLHEQHIAQSAGGDPAAIAEIVRRGEADGLSEGQAGNAYDMHPELADEYTTAINEDAGIVEGVPFEEDGNAIYR